MTTKKKGNNKRANTIAKEKRMEDFMRAFSLSAGNITLACKKANISRNTAHRWFNENPEFREQWIDVKEGLKDMAESMLLKAIKDGKTTELIFFLKTQCKDRGYVERVENINTQINPVDEMTDEEVEKMYNEMIEEQRKFDDLKRKNRTNKET